MSMKRSSSQAIHPSRRPNIDELPTKRRRPNLSSNSTFSSDLHSVNALKCRIRDVTRLLERSKNLPADVRIEKERALTGYRADLEHLEGVKRKADMVKRYHMVRFFERQKATRALKRLHKQQAAISSDTPEHDALAPAIHEAEVDLNYTMYYPLAEKYQSLYPRKEGGNDDEQECGGEDKPKRVAQKPPLWHVIELAMAEGTLEGLRDRQSLDIAIGKAKSSVQKPISAGTSKSALDQVPERGVLDISGQAKDKEDEDNNMSDGGFFEE